MGDRRHQTRDLAKSLPLGDRGIALVVVLWTLLLLSLIAAGFLAVTRTEVQLARNAVANARPRRWPTPGCIAASRRCSGFSD